MIFKKKEVDIGDIAEVPEDERLDHDEEEDANALGADHVEPDLEEIRANPGELIEEDLA